MRTKHDLAEYLRKEGWKVTVERHLVGTKGRRAPEHRTLTAPDRFSIRIAAVKGKKTILVLESDKASDAIEKHGPPQKKGLTPRWGLNKSKRKPTALTPLI